MTLKVSLHGPATLDELMTLCRLHGYALVWESWDFGVPEV